MKKFSIILMLLLNVVSFNQLTTAAGAPNEKQAYEESKSNEPSTTTPISAASSNAIKPQQQETATCPICFKPSSENDSTVTLPCSGRETEHKFHTECLKTWIREQTSNNQDPKCPMCNTLIPLNIRSSLTGNIPNNILIGNIPNDIPISLKLLIIVFAAVLFKSLGWDALAYALILLSAYIVFEEYIHIRRVMRN
jgi:hypothetical protein